MSDERELNATCACPNEETLYAFLDGEMDAEGQVLMLRHLSVCEACRQSMTELSQGLTQVSEALRDPLPNGSFPEVEMGALEAHIMGELKASGRIKSRRGRLDAGALALKLARGAAKGTQVAAASLVGGAKAAYSGALAISRVTRPAIKVAEGASRAVGGAGRAAAWVAGHSPWRLAW